MRRFSCAVFSSLDFTSELVSKMFLEENVFNKHLQKSAVWQSLN